MTISGLSFPLKIGTRASLLAVKQAEAARDRLMAALGRPQDDFKIVRMSTTGDRIQDRTLSEIGGKGLFTQEIEAGLLDGSLDIAVHSTKDMPTRLPDGLVLAAYLPREDVRDAFISPTAATLMELPAGGVVGTASLRRGALVRHLRPDLQVIPFRGNVQTRLRKLEEGQADATLLAEAGLRRLAMTGLARETLDPARFVPAVGQGAVCIEAATGRAEILAALALVHDEDTAIGVAAERAMLAVLDGSCHTPIAAHTLLDGGRLFLRGMVLAVDGARVVEDRQEVMLGAEPLAEAEALGRAVGDSLLRKGAAKLIAAARE